MPGRLLLQVPLRTDDSGDGASLVVEEAGGRATDFEGRRAIDSGSFIATNGHLHETIRARLLAGSGSRAGR